MENTIKYPGSECQHFYCAFFWFVAMWKIHGPTYLDSFLEDQVGIRVASRLLLIFQNGLLAYVLLIAMFIPWVLLAIPSSRIVISQCWKENATFFGFAILWGLAILAMGAMTSKFYERYLLPVAPVLAVLQGWILVRGEFELRKIGSKLASILFLSLSGVVLIAGIWLGVKGETHWSVWIQIGLAFPIFGYLILLTKKEAKLPKVITYAFLLIFFLLSTVTYHISLPHQGTQVRDFIQKSGIDSQMLIAFVGNLDAGSKIRMSLGPEFHLIDLPKSSWKERVNEYQRLIIEDKFLDSLSISEFEVGQASVNWDSKQIPELLKSYGKPEFDPLLNATGKKYFFLQRKKSLLKSQNKNPQFPEVLVNY